MTLEAFLSMAGIVLSIVALVVAVLVPFWIFRSELRERIFFEYTGRFGEIMKHLPNDVFDKDFDPKALSKDDVTLRWVKAYFDLCSEEVKLHIRHHIPSEVWADWEEGIRDAMDSPTSKWARQHLGLDQQYKVLMLFIDRKAEGLEAASAEYHTEKRWSEGMYG